MMRAIVLALAALISQHALALGPYKCRPTGLPGGTGAVLSYDVGLYSACAVWTCGQTMHVAVAAGPLPVGLLDDLDKARVSNASNLLNGVRDKYAKDDPCTALWDAWAACRQGLTPGQVTAICPAR